MTQGTSTMTQQKKTSPSFGNDLQPSKDFLQYLKDYSREKPDVAALWCFGIGFVVGWKLKPW
ncbi:MAG: hypothetical protein KDA52_12375 [Planctomycetaceae bacterium]|nr:hypothetical protein [Planctomycetaceae bacterium]